MYKILVTNDDGYESVGINRLVKALSELAVVYVVAPSDQQSAKSMSLTCRDTLHANEVEIDGAEVAYTLSGTPADCVKWGLGRFRGVVDFDYIISGINHGYNLSSAIYYSGTVGAAREGSLNEIKSIALSVQHHEATQFDFICENLSKFLEMSDVIGPHAVLNVNAPDIPSSEVKGIRVVDCAAHDYGDHYEFIPTEDGYEIKEYISEIDKSLKNDYNTLMDGYVSVTPITVDLANELALKKLQGYAAPSPVCIFMDAQDGTTLGLYKEDSWEANIIKWAKCVERLDLPTLITKQYNSGDVLEEIDVALPRAEHVVKVDFNAMNCHDFVDLLTSIEEKEVYLAGVETHIGLLQTARALRENGFKVTVVEDCCTAKTKQDHDIAIANMRELGCLVTSFDAAVMEMVGSNIHHAYNSLKEIIS